MDGNTDSPPAPDELPSPPPRSARLSWLALGSLLLGLWGFATILLLGIVPAVLGLICGHAALVKIQHSPETLRGRLAAYAGLTAGYATVLLTPVFAIVLTLAYLLLAANHEENRDRLRLENASELFRASETYARDHGGRYPETWDRLRGRYLTSADLDRLLAGQHLTFAGSVRSRLARLASKAPPPPAETAFALVPHERPILRQMEGSVMVIRELAPPEVERVVVAYDNGVTAWIGNPNRE